MSASSLTRLVFLASTADTLITVNVLFCRKHEQPVFMYRLRQESVDKNQPISKQTQKLFDNSRIVVSFRTFIVAPNSRGSWRTTNFTSDNRILNQTPEISQLSLNHNHLYSKICTKTLRNKANRPTAQIKLQT